MTSIDADLNGRLMTCVTGESEERFAYDPSGRLIDAVNRYSRVQFFFDPVGNLVREHHAYDLFGERRSYVWHHEYDELGNRRRTVRPDGHAVDWLMYGSGHVHGMLLDGEERVQFERDDLHRETVRVLSSKVGQRTHYDPVGRVLQQTIQRSTSPAPLAERRYRYDAAGQLSRIEDSRKGGTDYRYDPVGRLIEAISPVAKERFAFDPASNIIDPVRTTETPASRPSPVRPTSTLPVEVPKVLGNLLKAYAGMHFEYDARGNLVRKRTPAGEQEYEWDEFNRLLFARVAETSRQSRSRYFYDAFGRRIAKEVNGERTVFGWDGDTLAYESDGERGTHYIYEPGTFVPLAQYVAGPVEGIATPEWKSTDRYVPEEDPLQKMPERRADAKLFYYHCDQIGTPQLLTDDDGDIVWEASYKAWGEAREVIARASTVAGIEVRNSLRFQGQRVDEETGLHYNRHRYYDAQSGRFVSKDPIGLVGGINVYAYVANPTGWIDPLGLEGSPCDGFGSLAARRQSLGLPAAGSEGDTSTLSLLRVNGQSFEGINSSDQNPKTPITLDRVNAQTKTHAEAEAVQKAVNAGMAGKASHAEMWVDRDPCRACGIPGAGGLRSLARNLGCPITVHSPSGTQVYTPTK